MLSQTIGYPAFNISSFKDGLVGLGSSVITFPVARLGKEACLVFFKFKFKILYCLL